MVHLNGSVEKLAENVWLKLISRILMPVVVTILTVISGYALNFLVRMDERIDTNAAAIFRQGSDIRNIETIRKERIDPHLRRLDRRIGRCCYSSRPEEEQRP